MTEAMPWNFMWTIAFRNGRPTAVKSYVQHLVNNKRFDHLDLSASTADVVIKPGKKYQVTYYGMSGEIPTARLNGKKLSVSQVGHANSILINENSNDLIVITVPKGHAIKGKISLAEGNLTVSKVNLSNCNVNVKKGDVTYKQAFLKGGKTTLSEGDFTGNNLTINGHYVVDNNEGDNKVTKTKVDGYSMQTHEGNNELNGVDHDSQTIERNMTAQNLLTLQNYEGDNEFK